MHPLSTYDVVRSDHRLRLTASARLRTRAQRRASRRTDASGRPPERPQSRPVPVPVHAHGWTLTS
ncbi:hypothetical protein [Cellulomonas shaoxiangyii]|uniref:Uncharacterized protein n=1 Tax=Cellulomonas shaoxiangyii TaxID=2566013 RepID=A0A4P7SKS7_9CELL|nr:hypothetical protein [Cellulomonas shaoxiangyii]QCB94077.1 hypothetical protein E5225_11385 [Cellulomonas shaoxiangyii]TGY83761.1 hypothetical protein E5226_11895 [Cellulomonas shaoxiangyii]